MSGPGDDDEVFQNRDGDDVPWEDLSDAEQHWHEDDSTDLNIGDYCQNWGRGEAFDKDTDDEAFDKDSD